MVGRREESLDFLPERPTLKCNVVFCEEYLIWGFEPKGFSRAVVEFVHDGQDGLFGDLGEVAGLGEILADQAVGILIEASLPGGVGMGKEERGL